MVTVTSVNPVQVTSCSGGHIVHHALGVAVVWVRHTRGGLLGKVGLLHGSEGSPHFASGWDKNGLGLSNTIHFNSPPELAPLVEIKLKPFCVIVNYAIIQSS